MRTMTMVFLFCLISSIANAESFVARKPIVCDETKTVIRSLTETFKEKPMWTAKDVQDDSRYSLFVNEKTGAWTLVQMTPDYACVLGVGEDSKLIGDSI